MKLSRGRAMLAPLITAITASMLIIGCAHKNEPQSVIVAPQKLTGYTGKIYTGGAVVDNTEETKKAAAALPSLVHFDYNSDILKPQAMQILDTQAAFLTNNTAARVLVAGHTDERGSREYNMSLGERRAVAVGNYLLSKGVQRANIEIVSFGEERPIATESNEASWSKNRRAELSY